MNRALLFSFLIVTLFSGCATVSQSNLYWGNYSHTLYEVKKNPGEQSKKAHQHELLSIVEKSKARNLKVPPGIYAELGVYAKESGDSNAANNYFHLEQETYPESSALMKHALDN
jgi:hypothetical protein